MHADPTRREIVLGSRAHELRAYVGSAAWAVLEEMMQRSTDDLTRQHAVQPPTPQAPLEAVLLGRHLFTGESLGRELLDRIDQKGNVMPDDLGPAYRMRFFMSARFSCRALLTA